MALCSEDCVPERSSGAEGSRVVLAAAAASRAARFSAFSVLRHMDCTNAEIFAQSPPCASTNSSTRRSASSAAFTSSDNSVRNARSSTELPVRRSSVCSAVVTFSFSLSSLGLLEVAFDLTAEEEELSGALDLPAEEEALSVVLLGAELAAATPFGASASDQDMTSGSSFFVRIVACGNMACRVEAIEPWFSTSNCSLSTVTAAVAAEGGWS